jgi:hypothetical protein
MFSRATVSVVLVFILWSVLDFLVHGMLLMPQYEATEALWLPQEEMRMALMFAVRFVSVMVFTLLYVVLISPKHVGRGLLYGLLYGIAAGTTMGYGSYSYMDIPYEMAFIWFVNAVLQMILAGAIVGWLIRENGPAVP